MNHKAKVFCQIIARIPADRKGQKKLAERADVSPQTLWNWVYGETMTPRIDTLSKVTEALGGTVEIRWAGKLRKVA